MPALTHVHSYIRWKISRTRNKVVDGELVFKCNDPHCTHFDRRSAILGNASTCPSCGTEFLLTLENLRRAVPKCLNCSNTKEAREHKMAKSLVEGAMNELGIGERHGD